MAEIGKLYTLARDPSVSTYGLCNTWNVSYKIITEWISAEKFLIPFMILSEYGSDENYWIQILIEDKTGWIHIDPDQLRIYKSYR